MIFGQKGQVVYVRFAKPAPSTPVGAPLSAEVCFATTKEAKNSLALSGHVINGIRIQVTSVATVGTADPASRKRPDRHSWSPRHTGDPILSTTPSQPQPNAIWPLRNPQQNGVHRHDPENHQADKNLYILNIPLTGCDSSELKKLVAHHGTVVHCMVLAKLDGMARRRGFVVMDSHAEALKVKNDLHGYVWNDFTLDVSFAHVQRTRESVAAAAAERQHSRVLWADETEGRDQARTWRNSYPSNLQRDYADAYGREQISFRRPRAASSAALYAPPQNSPLPLQHPFYPVSCAPPRDLSATVGASDYELGNRAEGLVSLFVDGLPKFFDNGMLWYLASYSGCVVQATLHPSLSSGKCIGAITFAHGTNVWEVVNSLDGVEMPAGPQNEDVLLRVYLSPDGYCPSLSREHGHSVCVPVPPVPSPDLPGTRATLAFPRGLSSEPTRNTYSRPRFGHPFQTHAQPHPTTVGSSTSTWSLAPGTPLAPVCPTDATTRSKQTSKPTLHRTISLPRKTWSSPQDPWSPFGEPWSPPPSCDLSWSRPNAVATTQDPWSPLASDRALFDNVLSSSNESQAGSTAWENATLNSQASSSQQSSRRSSTPLRSSSNSATGEHGLCGDLAAIGLASSYAKQHHSSSSLLELFPHNCGVLHMRKQAISEHHHHL